MDKVLGLVLFCVGGLSAQGVPHYLANTFFGNSKRISVPQIPNSISGPALNAPSFIPLQQSFSQQPQVALTPQVTLSSQAPLSRPLAPAFPNVRPEIALSQRGQPGLSQFSGVVPNAGNLPGAPFVNLGQPAPAPPAPLQPGSAGAPPLPEPEPQRKGKAIESGPASKPQSGPPPSGSFNQFGPGPDGPLKESLGKALDEASKSVDFSIPPSDSPGIRSGPPLVNRPRPGPSSDFPQRQTLSGAPRPGPPSPSGPPPPSSALNSFNQFRAGGDQAQISLQESLGQALDQASKSAQFSLPGGSSPGPGEGGAPLTRQGPTSFPQRSGAPFPQRLDSPSLQSSRPPQFSSRPSANGIPGSPQPDLEEALNKASEEALGRTGPGIGAPGRPGLGGGAPDRPGLGGGAPDRQGLGSRGQFSVIPAVPSGPPQSGSLLEEVKLGSPTNPSRSSGSNLFRGNTGNPSSPLIRQQSNRSPSRAQSGPPLVFDATPPGSGFDRQPFRSDPKISEQRIPQSSKPSNSKIFLGSTRLSESPRSSSLASSGRKTERIPVKSCTKTFHEECHNEYKMVCEETFTEKEKYECNVVEETKCENGYTTEYEPACFQQILENCENICKRGIQPDCMPQCARSLGKTSCHKVKVVTPHTTCTKVPKEVCANVKKRVPYEKCHDVPKKVCEQVPREVCK